MAGLATMVSGWGLFIALHAYLLASSYVIFYEFCCEYSKVFVPVLLALLVFLLPLPLLHHTGLLAQNPCPSHSITSNHKRYIKVYRFD